jgi:hypothetical protein
MLINFIYDVNLFKLLSKYIERIVRIILKTIIQYIQKIFSKIITL